MNRRTLTTAAMLGLLLAAGAGELLAAGQGQRGHMGGQRRGAANCTQTQGQTRSATGPGMATRPVDSQRRDGTFLSTGTTANGSTERPGHGNGLQNGSGTGTPTIPSTPATP